MSEEQGFQAKTLRGNKNMRPWTLKEFSSGWVGFGHKTRFCQRITISAVGSSAVTCSPGVSPSLAAFVSCRAVSSSTTSVGCSGFWGEARQRAVKERHAVPGLPQSATAGKGSLLRRRRFRVRKRAEHPGELTERGKEPNEMLYNGMYCKTNATARPKSHAVWRHLTGYALWPFPR